MKVELEINNSVDPRAQFVSWAPSPCRIRVTDPSGAAGPTANVQLTSVSAASAGAVVFRKGTTGAFSNSVTVSVPVTGASVPFFVAGKFGRPSVNNGDVRIEARVTPSTGSPQLVGSARLMVRVRKNADTLTPGERDRFLAALGRLNNQGLGRFKDFRDMHTTASDLQSHRAPGFLPWHRAYLLDLERELQAIDASVSLPYWRFDRAAPNLFTTDFIGVSGPNGTVQFSNTNPLQFWTTDNVLGVNRRPLNNWNPATQPAPIVINETQTLALGGSNNLYRLFRGMEGNPHGQTHVSFGGSISVIGTAAKDPLFFLLHCNVDRLWAKWQRQNGRFDPAQAASYDSTPASRVGHNLPDTMWPWNGVTGGTRPPTAPGGTLAASPCVSAPGPQPRVRDCLDYQGSVNAISGLGFDYDDVRFV
ncbi:MAG: tyrosinase family protein [Blastocatellia bacterium]